jgi:predicted O-linked N-acetylglucosamine transferase (SPINDLY family)
VNRPLKVTGQVAAVWAEILRRAPGSRLLMLLGMRCRSSQHMSGLFALHGVDPARIEFVERMTRRDYFRLIGERIDVALDPFPYNGGVTTGDLLWMGVPAMAMAGNAYWSRQGAMLLNNVGLRELAAPTPERYVEIALETASDVPKLARLRRSLRAAMAASPLCDIRGLARALEQAYQSMRSVS